VAKIHSGNPLATVPGVTGLTFIRPPKVWRRRLQPPDSVHLRRAACGESTGFLERRVGLVEMSVTLLPFVLCGVRGRVPFVASGAKHRQSNRS